MIKLIRIAKANGLPTGERKSEVLNSHLITDN
jgi:hypothetical protein